MPSKPPVPPLALAAILGFGTLLAVAPATSATVDGPSSECTVDTPVAGAWSEVDGDWTVRFSEREYALAIDGRLDLMAPVVACGPGRVEICSFGRRHVFDVTVEGDRLTIHDRSADTRRTYRRLESVPDLFDPEPMAIPPGEAQRLAAERVEEIRAELARRLALDQEVREPPVEGPEMMRVDRDNTAYLKELVRQVGWIDPQRFGPDAADAAFLIVQHSGDLPLMLAALPHLEEQDRSEEYALLYDRLQIRRALPQRYGTQLGWAEGGTMGLLPIETLDGIDEIRAAVGLPPLDEYLARFDLHERRVLDCR